MEYVLYGLMALQVISAISGILLIGEPRKDRSKTEAVVGLVVAILFFYFYWLVLQRI